MSALPLYLLRVEGQNFRWVFDDTHDLSTIAGGSRMLAFVPILAARRLEAMRRSKTLFAYRAIQQAASIGLFAICPGSVPMASVLLQIREALRTDNFRHMTISVEAIEASTVELIDKCGKLTISLEKISVDFEKRLIAASRFGQMRAPTLAVPQIVTGVNQACGEDHVRPAEGNRKLSASVQARRELGRYFRWKSGTGGVKTARTVYDFNQMTDCPKKPRWHGKLAVICIDGKGFTSLRNDLCKTAADLNQFSDKLNELLNGFHIALMEKWVQNEEDSRYFYTFAPNDEKGARNRPAGQLLRFQRLVTAGDDATYLMPAWLAWEFLTIFFGRDWKWQWEVQPGAGTSQAKADAIDALKTSGLTFRTGVVICHAKASIHPVRELAHTLESDVAAEDGKYLANSIAYEVLKSYDFIGSGLEEYRKKKRAGLEAHEALLDGGNLDSLQRRLEQMQKDASSGEIKSPLRWGDTLKRLNETAELPASCGKYQLGDLFHMSQWRDYIFDRSTQ